MSIDLIHSLLANVWTTFLVVLFFGGSIFVHELGHFLAARRRGVHVERFSIGFGPAIWSWRGRDGVEYRVAWFPLGGYVLLPQLADLGAIEGKSEADPNRLPPVGYASKMIVFAAGALFNILFAFALACVIWIAGQPESNETATTRIGYVSPTLDLPDGSQVPSPAVKAGLRVGDWVRAIDGRKISVWSDLMEALTTSSGRDAAGQPRSVFTVERDGKQIDLTIFPRLAGDEKFRRVGILPAFPLVIHRVSAGSLASRSGFEAGDEVTRLGGEPIMNNVSFGERLEAAPGQPIPAVVIRAGRETQLVIPSRAGLKPGTDFGLTFDPGFRMVHPSPFGQLWGQVAVTFRTLGSLLNPRSDIGLSKMAGPVGIVHMFTSAAESGIRIVILFTILVNVNLAIFNLLPMPVLDGGQMVFATIGRLRGRALPMNFIVAAQSVFLVLIFSMILYMSYSDVRRWARDSQSERAAAAAAAADKP